MSDVFPIYSIAMRHKADPPRDVSFHRKMFRTRSEAELWLPAHEQEFRDAISKKGCAQSDYTFDWSFSYEESWCPTWFSHYTFRDRFNDPGKVLADFEDYVGRVRRLQGFCDHPRPDDIDAFEKRTGRKWVVLMGAEEHWRWSGREHGDPPPCRCADCEKAGVWRITH